MTHSKTYKVANNSVFRLQKKSEILSLKNINILNKLHIFKIWLKNLIIQLIPVCSVDSNLLFNYSFKLTEINWTIKIKILEIIKIFVGFKMNTSNHIYNENYFSVDFNYLCTQVINNIFYSRYKYHYYLYYI